jgi:hypothetical protein
VRKKDRDMYDPGKVAIRTRLGKLLSDRTGCPLIDAEGRLQQFCGRLGWGMLTSLTPSRIAALESHIGRGDFDAPPARPAEGR